MGHVVTEVICTYCKHVNAHIHFRICHFAVCPVWPDVRRARIDAPAREGRTRVRVSGPPATPPVSRTNKGTRSPSPHAGPPSTPEHSRKRHVKRQPSPRNPDRVQPAKKAKGEQVKKGAPPSGSADKEAEQPGMCG